MEHDADVCPVNGVKGKAVKVVTLKALLTPQALATLEPHEQHRFCLDPDCPTVYYSPSRTYRGEDLKVPVFQKDPGADVPVCYCFAHTRRDLGRAVQENTAERIPRSIRAHIQAGRCGCEVTNPQGSCCLGNVTRAVSARRSNPA